jgi:taurine dioxygenase
VVNDLATYTAVKQLTEHLQENPAVIQPMVRTHPETKRKALYLNESVTRQIDGMTQAESDGLLQYLFKHSVRHNFTFRHRWKKHDIVMWDNRCAMHLAAGDYDKNEIRQMYRTTIEGESLGVLESQAN